MNARTIVASLAAVAVVALVLGAGALPSPTAIGQEPFPTPRGQLGGPERLDPTPPFVPSPPPPPTPTPPPAPSPSPAASPAPAATASPSPTPADQADQADQAAGAAGDWTQVAARVVPAVVTLEIVPPPPGPDLGPGGGPATAGGSGFYVDEAGHVVTAAALVEGASSVAVLLPSGERRPAAVVGVDPLTGVAVLRADGAAPAVLSLDRAAEPAPGVEVLALGTAFGILPGTLERGLVSSVDRALPDGPPATRLIQHDGQILPGMAGGPVVDRAGAVVGLSLPPRLAGLGGFPPGSPGDLPGLGPALDAPGVGFAVPVATLARVVPDLIADGAVVYPYLGLSVEAAAPPAAGGLPTLGVQVAEVAPGGPADAGGVEPGDLLLAFAGQRVATPRDFTDLLFARRPGEAVELTVRRGDQEQTVAVTLGERPVDTGEER